MTNLVSPVGNFEEINAFVSWNWPKNTQLSLKEQTSTLLDKLIPFSVQTTTVFEE